MSVERAVRRRLATQRLDSAPLPTAGEVVRLLLCVQSQDAPLAAWSLGMRSRTQSYAALLAEQTAGGFVRTHILRPTWHFVAPEDVRWLLTLTSPRVESSMAARHRQLELDERTIGASLDALGELLDGPTPLTRRQIGPLMAERGLPGPGERVGHLLLLAELRGLICSGPPADREHTYVLLDETVPRSPDDPADREEAILRLVRRFVRGHGPVGIADLMRWAVVTKGDITRALDALRSELDRVEVDGEPQWLDPSTPPRARAGAADTAYLVPTFDEATLTYARTGIPRPDGHPRGTQRLSPAEAGGGTVVCGRRDVGVWGRTVTAGKVRVRLDLADGLSADERRQIDDAVGRLVSFVTSQASGPGPRDEVIVAET